METIAVAKGGERREAADLDQLRAAAKFFSSKVVAEGSQSYYTLIAMTQLSVATWNVLADCYVTPDLYPKTPAEFLLPGARTAKIVGELLRMVDRLRLDAVCLQEVEEGLFAELQSASLPRAWKALGCRETDTARAQCAVLICGSWTLGAYDCLPYTHAPGNCAQRLVLLHGDTAAVLYNTHFRWAPDNGWLIGAQGAELASWVAPENHPTIVAGDLNSPSDSPALQQLIEIGLKDLHPDESLRTAEFCDTGPLRADYILVREARGRPLSAIDIVVDGIEPLPGRRCPSDHIPLAARLFMPART